MKWLDDNVDVISYEYEKLTLPYVSNVKTRKIRNYIPDILVRYVDRNELIEIKPKRKLTNRIVQKKSLSSKRMVRKKRCFICHYDRDRTKTFTVDMTQSNNNNYG